MWDSGDFKKHGEAFYNRKKNGEMLTDELFRICFKPLRAVHRIIGVIVLRARCTDTEYSGTEMSRVLFFLNNCD
jgi:hypothetical protein